MCFDATAFTSWLTQARARGVTLPVRVGVSGPVKLAKLTELSLRIGVGQSLRFLGKQHGLVGNVLMGRTYDPAPFLRAVLAGQPGRGDDVEGLHVFTFNQVAACQDWLDTQRGARA